jgi:exonuclease SbcD
MSCRRDDRHGRISIYGPVMINFLVRTDVHIHDKPPESRRDNYMETVLDKLRQIGQMAKERNVTAVLDNGDFFHNKSAARNSHALVKAVVDVHKIYPCPVYENPGNHDFPYGNVDYINRQPLGVLFATGVFQRMDDILFQDVDLSVRVVGLPYKVEFDVFEFDIQRGDEDILIVCAHTFASPTGTERFGREQFLSYRDLSECSPDIFVFGHLHTDQGIQEVGGKTFINLGSLTRGSLTDDNLSRIPRIGYIEVTKNDGQVSIHTEPLEIRVRPAEEVFDLVTHERVQQERRDIERFIETLSRSSVEEGDNLQEVIQHLDMESIIKERALDYLARTDV